MWCTAGAEGVRSDLRYRPQPREINANQGPSSAVAVELQFRPSPFHQRGRTSTSSFSARLLRDRREGRSAPGVPVTTARRDGPSGMSGPATWPGGVRVCGELPEIAGSWRIRRWPTCACDECPLLRSESLGLPHRRMSASRPSCPFQVLKLHLLYRAPPIASYAWGRPGEV